MIIQSWQCLSTTLTRILSLSYPPANFSLFIKFYKCFLETHEKQNKSFLTSTNFHSKSWKISNYLGSDTMYKHFFRIFLLLFMAKLHNYLQFLYEYRQYIVQYSLYTMHFLWQFFVQFNMSLSLGRIHII